MRKLVINTKVIRAGRKSYRCTLCKGPIEAGEPSTVQRIVTRYPTGEKMDYARLCTECVPLTEPVVEDPLADLTARVEALEKAPPPPKVTITPLPLRYWLNNLKEWYFTLSGGVIVLSVMLPLCVVVLLIFWLILESL